MLGRERGKGECYIGRRDWNKSKRERKGGMLYRKREGRRDWNKSKRERKGGMLYRKREGRRDWNKSKREC